MRIQERAEEMCAIMGLQRAADSLIGDEVIPGISGGQKKRVAVGTELIPDPNFLFLDEPTSGKLIIMTPSYNIHLFFIYTSLINLVSLPLSTPPPPP